MAVASPTQELTLTRVVQAPASDVYRAFTDRDGLYYWLCNNALVNARVGGPALLTWNTGYYAFVTFTALEPDKRIRLTWRGQGETNDSVVEVDLEAADGRTTLTLKHSGFDTSANPDAYRQEWENHLRNLVSYLETGADLRITERVIVGIFPGLFNEEVAERLGVPVTDGTLVGSVLEGMGAQQAGLQANDVIVEVDGQQATQQNPMFQILANRKPGDEVSLVFYRGAEKHSTTLKLSGYPVPEVPADFQALAGRVRALYDQLDGEMTALLRDVSEAAAERKPAPDAWNVKEVLAHLILNERWMQNQLGGYFQGPEIAGYTGNTPPRISAVTATYPTLAALQQEMRRAWSETVALVRSVTTEVRPYVLWWSSFNYHGYPQHTRQHFDQIRDALKAG